MICRLFFRRMMNASMEKPCSRTAERHLSNGYHKAATAAVLDLPLPPLPAAPPHPCHFLTAPDVEEYLMPLYREGWGVSRIPTNPSAIKTVTPATRLSKKIVWPNSEIARLFNEDVLSTIIEQENHHPSWDNESDDSVEINHIHVYTHTALAPPDRQNVDDQGVFTRNRPGITHRDVRFAILFEILLRDYIHHGLLEPQFHTNFPQPTEIDVVHNFRALPSHFNSHRRVM